MPIFLVATDLTGAPKSKGVNRPAPVRTVHQPQVTIPLSDSRTGELTVSMYEAIAAVITAGDTAIKVTYRSPKGTNTLILNGIVVQPTYDLDAATIDFTLQDPTIWLKHRYLGYSQVSICMGLGLPFWNPPPAHPGPGVDPGIDAYSGGALNGLDTVYGIPLDGVGLRTILYDAAHGTIPRGGAVPFGIRPGRDDATPQPALENADYGALAAPPNDAVGPPYGVGGVQSDGISAGTPFKATATKGSNILTDVDFAGVTRWDGSPAAIADIVRYQRIDGASIPQFGSVVSAAGTEITMNLPAVSDGVAEKFITEGDCCYDDITDMVQAAGGFECDWIPVDAENLGMSGDAWNPGEMCELYTANRIGTDRTKGNTSGEGGAELTPVVFVHGQGGFHLTYAPDADQMCTYVVECGSGGQIDPNDYLNKIELISNTAQKYGYYQDWEQATEAGEGDSPISNALLYNRGVGVLTAYQVPPQFLTAKIDSDKVSGYCYGDDFVIGDTVNVYGKKGNFELLDTTGQSKSDLLEARIISVSFTETDENGNVQLDLTLVPHLTETPGVQAGQL